MERINLAGMRHRARGFSLVELMVSLAIVAIVAAVAYPAYTSHVIKGHRSAVQAYMINMATAQAQYAADTRTYATKAELAVDEPLAVSARYTVTIDNVSATTYTINAVPLVGTMQAGDLSFSLNQSGVKTPAGSW